MLHVSLTQKVQLAGRSMLHVDTRARPILALGKNEAPPRIVKGRAIQAMGQPPPRTGSSRQKAKLTHVESPKGARSHPYAITPGCVGHRSFIARSHAHGGLVPYRGLATCKGVYKRRFERERILSQSEEDHISGPLTFTMIELRRGCLTAFRSTARPAPSASAFRKSAVCRAASQASTARVLLRLPLRLKFGESVSVTGPLEGLGAWMPKNAPRLAWTEGHVWQIELELPTE